MRAATGPVAFVCFVLMNLACNYHHFHQVFPAEGEKYFLYATAAFPYKHTDKYTEGFIVASSNKLTMKR